MRLCPIGVSCTAGAGAPISGEVGEMRQRAGGQPLVSLRVAWRAWRQRG